MSKMQARDQQLGQFRKSLSMEAASLRGRGKTAKIGSVKASEKESLNFALDKPISGRHIKNHKSNHTQVEKETFCEAYQNEGALIRLGKQKQEIPAWHLAHLARAGIKKTDKGSKCKRIHRSTLVRPKAPHAGAPNGRTDMGNQRAHRKNDFQKNLIEETLRRIPTTGFHAVIEARMALPILVRTAQFSCRCGVKFTDYSGFPSDSAWRCSKCLAIYRIEHAFDRSRFEQRPRPTLLDWCQIGEAVELIGLSIQDAWSELGVRIPIRTEQEPTFGGRIGSQSVHYDVQDDKNSATRNNRLALYHLVLNGRNRYGR